MPIFGFLLIQRCTGSAFIKTCEAASSIRITTFRGNEEPSERLLWIRANTLTPLITDPHGILGLNHPSLRGCKLKLEPFLFIARHAATVQITLAQPVNCRVVTMRGSLAKPRDSLTIVSAHGSSFVIEDAHVVLGIGITSIGSYRVMFERAVTVSTDTQPVIVQRAQPGVSLDVALSRSALQQLEAVPVVLGPTPWPEKSSGRCIQSSR